MVVTLRAFRLAESQPSAISTDVGSASDSAKYDVSHFIGWNRVASKAKEVPDGAGPEDMEVDEELADDAMSPRTMQTHDLLLYSGRDM
jgi:hypothetical protein